MSNNNTSAQTIKNAIELLDKFTYETDEDWPSNSFFEAKINEDWFFDVKSRLEKLHAEMTAHARTCSDEMTPAQIENWGNHQKVSSVKITNTTLPILTWETSKRKGEL